MRSDNMNGNTAPRPAQTRSPPRPEPAPPCRTRVPRHTLAGLRLLPQLPHLVPVGPRTFPLPPLARPRRLTHPPHPSAQLHKLQKDHQLHKDASPGPHSHSTSSCPATQSTTPSRRRAGGHSSTGSQSCSSDRPPPPARPAVTQRHTMEIEIVQPYFQCN